MQSGELIVTGKDQVAICLKNFPSKVVVSFGNECVIVPCNPKHADALEWQVTDQECNKEHSCDKHGKHCLRRGKKLSHCHCCSEDSCYKLLISWDVTGVREIKWSVYY